MQTHQVALCLQDTTELDSNGREAMEVGPLTYEAQRGTFVHPTYAVTPQREPLRMLNAWIWAREKKDQWGQAWWPEGKFALARRLRAYRRDGAGYALDRLDLMALMEGADALGNPAGWQDKNVAAGLMMLMLIVAGKQRASICEVDRVTRDDGRQDALNGLALGLDQRGRHGTGIQRC